MKTPKRTAPHHKPDVNPNSKPDDSTDDNVDDDSEVNPEDNSDNSTIAHPQPNTQSNPKPRVPRNARRFPPGEQPLRNVRCLCMSDIHEDFERFSPPNLPPPSEVDIVFVSGDLTQLGVELSPMFIRHFEADIKERLHAWMRDLSKSYPRIYWIPGNHDIGLQDTAFDDLERELGTIIRSVRNKPVYDAHTNLRILGHSVTLVIDAPALESVWAHSTINLQLEAETYLNCPPQVQVMLSHAPPFGVLDRNRSGNNIGSPGLNVWLGNPRNEVRLVVCGHVHEAAGFEKFERALILNTARKWKLVTLER
jgi:uncharacterized protein